jgi:DNA polymerase-3 subunit epsilon
MTLRRRLRELLAPAARPHGDETSPPDDAARWIVLDVESSGLDPNRDRLIAVAAIALHWPPNGSTRAPCIALHDSFEGVLRAEAPIDKPNILLHGVGIGAQREGLDPGVALGAFERWAGSAPLMAFHAPFDRRLLERAAQAHLGHGLRNAWLDLAPLAGVLLPEVPARSLDEWLDHFGLTCAMRHQAAADTLVTAELFQRLWPALRAQVGARPAFRRLQRLAAQRRWLPH